MRLLLEAKKPILIAGSLLWLSLSACTNTAKPTTLNKNDSNQSNAQTDAENMNSTTASTADKQNANANLQSVPTSISAQSNSQALALAGAPDAFELTLSVTAYSIGLASCATGYTSTATQASPNLQVFKQDKGCLAQLNSFTYNGNVYTPVSGSGFSTWLTGDTATFAAPIAANVPNISVKVVSQLASPIVSTDAVSYQFYVITKGTTNVIANTTVGEGHSMTVVGQDPPDYDINAVTFGGVSVSGGSGLFTFKMICHTGAVTGTVGNHVCTNVPQNQIKYKLVQDTYNSAITIQQAQAIMSAGTTTVNDTTDYISTPGNGGFNSQQLTGPSQMSLNLKMILVLQSNGLSYQYWPVQVQALVQP